MTTQKNVETLGLLLGQALEVYNQLVADLNTGGSVAQADRVITQAALGFAPERIELGQIVILLNATTQQSGKAMLKGLAYIGDGTAEPIECPTVLWEADADRKYAYSGKLESEDSKVGGCWLYQNDKGSLLSLSIEIDSPEFDGRYSGQLTEGVADFDYMVTLLKDGPKKEPKLAQTSVKQKMFASTTHIEEVEAKIPAKTLLAKQEYQQEYVAEIVDDVAEEYEPEEEVKVPTKSSKLTSLTVGAKRTALRPLLTRS
jgi:hypothetical protein